MVKTFTDDETQNLWNTYKTKYSEYYNKMITTNMIIRTFATTIALQIVLNLEVSDCQSMESNSPFRAPGTFCGPKLTEQLHDFCQFFYGPADVVPMDRKNRKVIADECCQVPCSILYIILNYCKEPKDEAIRKTFGEEEMKIYEDTKRNVANGSLDMLTLNKTLETVIPQASEDQHENVRKKKHVRKFRKKKKPCKCRRKIKIYITIQSLKFEDKVEERHKCYQNIRNGKIACFHYNSLETEEEEEEEEVIETKT
ncbi:hypothetical protein HUJ05_005780 [Dendroctonus ponderosae]|nr:hypothetical protein HUJ05_005780 [Dendroctonus ponderosae]